MHLITVSSGLTCKNKIAPVYSFMKAKGINAQPQGNPR